jgi:hypothetical protein
MARQPAVAFSALPRIGAKPGPSVTIRLSNASRRADSSGGAVSRTMARASARPAQPPRACNKRAAINVATPGATAAAKPEPV